MSEECRHTKISSEDFVTCEGCGFKVRDILAALQSELAAEIAQGKYAREEIAALRHDIERHVAIAAEQAMRIAQLEAKLLGTNLSHDIGDEIMDDYEARIAALEKVAETASEILRLCAKNFERSTLWADWQNLDDALREAGYGGGE